MRRTRSCTYLRESVQLDAAIDNRYGLGRTQERFERDVLGGELPGQLGPALGAPDEPNGVLVHLAIGSRTFEIPDERVGGLQIQWTGVLFHGGKHHTGDTDGSVRRRATGMAAWHGDGDADRHQPLLGESDAGKSLAKVLVDARKALVEDEGHTVTAIPLENVLREVARTARSSDLFVKALRCQLRPIISS